MKKRIFILCLYCALFSENMSGQSKINCLEIVIPSSQSTDRIFEELKVYQPFLIDKNQPVNLGAFQTLFVPADLDLNQNEFALRDSIRTLFSHKKSILIIDGIRVQSSSVTIKDVTSILRIFISEMQKKNCNADSKVLVLLPNFKDLRSLEKDTNPKILITVNRNEAIFFENELISYKELDRKLSTFEGQDHLIITISAKVGTPLSYVTNLMSLCNKYKLRTTLATQ